MAQWYVKDLSKLTGVSVQTLHHYDKIGLLKPSARSESRYRLYSEADLLKLQQIIALKFFGFSLARIRELVSGNMDLPTHFSSQALLLEKKAKTLLDAGQALKSILSECQFNKSIPWETIIKMIEVYHMTQELENTLSSKVFTEDEMKQYNRFKTDFENRFNEAARKKFDKDYSELVQYVESNIHKDPTSEFGIEIASRYMKMIDEIYGKEHANLKHAIWKKGFKTGAMNGMHQLTQETIAWLGTACDAYYNTRIKNIIVLSEANQTQAGQLLNSLIEEYAGDSKDLKESLLKEITDSPQASQACKKWLKQFN